MMQRGVRVTNDRSAGEVERGPERWLTDGGAPGRMPMDRITAIRVLVRCTCYV